MADGNITVEVSTQAAQAELERLRAENARLAREAHAWWTAARDATVAERERCAQRVALHSQYPIQTDYDRGYDKARKDAAETLRNMSTYVTRMRPVMKVAKLTVDGATCVVPLRDLLDMLDDGAEYTVRVETMPVRDFERLPEFDGW